MCLKVYVFSPNLPRSLKNCLQSERNDFSSCIYEGTTNAKYQPRHSSGPGEDVI